MSGPALGGTPALASTKIGWAAIALGSLILACIATIAALRMRARLRRTEAILSQRTTDFRQREASFSAISGSVRDAIVMIDNTGKIKYWNPAAVRLFGYTNTEAQGQDLHRLLAGPEYSTGYRRGMDQFGDRGTGPAIGKLVELNARPKSGQPIPVELSLSAAQVDNAWHAIGVLRDVSTRKRSEQRLIRLNECLAHLGANYADNVQQITAVCGEILEAGSAFYNRMRDGLLVSLGRWQAPADMPLAFAPEGHICYDLIRGEQGLGENAEHPAGRRQQALDAFFFHDLSQTIYWQRSPAVQAYGLKAYFGHVVRCGEEKVGSLCVVFKQERSPTDEEKRLIGILAAALTTEENRHQAILELEISEKRISLATRGTGIGIWEYWPHRRRLRLDSAMHALLELAPILDSRPIDDWMKRLPTAVAQDFQLGIDALLAESGELNQRIALRQGVQGFRHLRVIGSRHKRGQDGEPQILGVCYDVTERIEAERQLRQAKELAEQTSRAKTHFLAQVSHDLRTPLNAVLGFTRLLANDPDLSEDQLDQVSEILQASERLLKLINDVIDLAGIESGAAKLSVQPRPLEPAIDEALSAIRARAARHELTVHREITPNIIVKADPFRLHQVLTTLLTNAVRFNRPGGSITIKVGAAPDAADRFRIGIRDTGTGIPGEQMREIVELFSGERITQAHDTRPVGLGLTVAQRLIDLMNGAIGADSIPGKGSCFWFELPGSRPSTVS